MLSFFEPDTITVYIDVNQFVFVKNNDGHEDSLTVTADTPFSNQRLLIADFEEAMTCLSQHKPQVKEHILTNRYTKTYCANVIITDDVLKKPQLLDGLSSIERRMIKELLLSVYNLRRVTLMYEDGTEIPSM